MSVWGLPQTALAMKRSSSLSLMPRVRGKSLSHFTLSSCHIFKVLAKKIGRWVYPQAWPTFSLRLLPWLLGAQRRATTTFVTLLPKNFFMLGWMQDKPRQSWGIPWLFTHKSTPMQMPSDYPQRWTNASHNKLVLNCYKYRTIECSVLSEILFGFCLVWYRENATPCNALQPYATIGLNKLGTIYA